MKQKKLASLKLNKKSISSLNLSAVTGKGQTQSTESIFYPLLCAGSEGSCYNTVCGGPVCDLQEPKPKQ